MGDAVKPVNKKTIDRPSHAQITMKRRAKALKKAERARIEALVADFLKRDTK